MKKILRNDEIIDENLKQKEKLFYESLQGSKTSLLKLLKIVRTESSKDTENFEQNLKEK